MSYTPGPLPKPYAHHAFWPEWDQWHDSADPLPVEWDDEPPTDVVHVFTASQMQTYAAAEVARAVAAERERLALTDELVERAYKEIWRDLPSDFDYTAHAWIEQGMRYVAALADPQRLQGKGEPA